MFASQIVSYIGIKSYRIACGNAAAEFVQRESVVRSGYYSVYRAVGNAANFPYKVFTPVFNVVRGLGGWPHLRVRVTLVQQFFENSAPCGKFVGGQTAGVASGRKHDVDSLCAVKYISPIVRCRFTVVFTVWIPQRYIQIDFVGNFHGFEKQFVFGVLHKRVAVALVHDAGNVFDRVRAEIHHIEISASVVVQTPFVVCV